MKYNFACILAAYVGDKDEALRLLEAALSLSGATQLRIAEADPDLDCLRDDPRFRKLLARERKRHGIEPAAAIEIVSPPAAS
jgi:adenylate cyclase